MFALALPAVCPAWVSGASLGNPRFDAVVTASMDQAFRMNYAAAESLLAGIPDDAPARFYFAGLICLNRFQDLGDTTALRRAELFWERLSPQAGAPTRFKEDASQTRVYQGLAAMQLSYIAALRGSRMCAASLIMTARNQLLPVAGIAEADAGLALFEYYRERLLEKIDFLPFIHPDTDLPVRRLEIAADGSRLMRDVFRISLFWMLIDRGEIDSALKIPEGFLKHYPHNRLARQMKGSALFHAGRLSEARAVYESLRREYAALRDSLSSNLPLGYVSAEGNLARIYAGLGMKAEMESSLREWGKALASGLAPWLPSSLKGDLKRLPKH